MSLAIFLSKVLMSGCLVEEDSEVADILFFSDTRPSIKKPTRVAKPMIPKPPTWIKKAKITCPVVDQWASESKVVRPVTVTAEVEVNRASKKFVTVPALDAAGNISKKVPKRIRAVKAAAISCVADSLDSFGISTVSILLR